MPLLLLIVGAVLFAKVDFSTIVGVVFPILTIIAGGIAILAYGSNKVLRDTAADLRDRVADLEGQATRDHALISSQAAELKVWQKAVTGEVQLVAILDLLGEHHKEAVSQWQHLNTTLTELLDYTKERDR